MKVKISETFECLGQIPQIPRVNFETTSQFKFCIILHCHDVYFLCTIISQTLYTLVKKSSLKCNILILFSTWVKIRQLPHVTLEVTSEFLFTFCIILHCRDT